MQEIFGEIMLDLLYKVETDLCEIVSHLFCTKLFLA